MLFIEGSGVGIKYKNRTTLINHSYYKGIYWKFLWRKYCKCSGDPYPQPHYVRDWEMPKNEKRCTFGSFLGYFSCFSEKNLKKDFGEKSEKNIWKNPETEKKLWKMEKSSILGNADFSNRK